MAAPRRNLRNRYPEARDEHVWCTAEGVITLDDYKGRGWLTATDTAIYVEVRKPWLLLQRWARVPYHDLVDVHDPIADPGSSTQVGFRTHFNVVTASLDQPRSGAQAFADLSDDLALHVHMRREITDSPQALPPGESQRGAHRRSENWELVAQLMILGYEMEIAEAAGIVDADVQASRAIQVCDSVVDKIGWSTFVDVLIEVDFKMDGDDTDAALELAIELSGYSAARFALFGW